jgi:tripartite-type tricarboxylate transporter receptor subunit TctC
LKQLLCAALCVALVAAGETVQAQYPSHPVKIVVPYPPGAITDTLPRLVAEKLRAEWGQPVIIDNRPGAGGRIATEFVGKSPPDGYTLLVALPDTLVIAPSLYRNIAYSARDFAPITLMARQAFVLVVRQDLAAASMVELMQLAKAHPGKLTMSSWGEGSTGHLALELLKSASGVDILHVPYKGAQAAMTGVLGGEVDMMITGYSTAGAHAKSGRIRVLARSSAERSATTPEIPTIAESGYPGYEVLTWYGLVAPSGTPGPVIDFIQRAVAKALASPDIREKVESYYAEVVGSSPEEFARVIRDDQGKWSAVLRAAKIQLD